LALPHLSTATEQQSSNLAGQEFPGWGASMVSVVVHRDSSQGSQQNSVDMCTTDQGIKNIPMHQTSLGDGRVS
jgi:hypothetical protein